MSEQYIIQKDELEKLEEYLIMGLPKGAKSDYRIFDTFNAGAITIGKMRVRLGKNTEEFTQMMIWYNGIPCVIKTRYKEKGLYRLACASEDDRMGFEFIPVADERAYRIDKAYGEIKLGMVNLLNCTHDKDTVENIFQLIKGMETDDRQDADETAVHSGEQSVGL